MLNADYLREVLSYNPEMGTFTWKISKAPNIQPGDIAGTLHTKGYVHIQIDGKKYRAHRLAWLWMTGEWPKNQIDHLDTVRNNNKWINLREATNTQNRQNQRKANKNNQNKLLGVSFSCGRWASQIGVDGKNIYLGRFDSPEKAHEVYINAKRQLHPMGTL